METIKYSNNLCVWIYHSSASSMRASNAFEVLFKFEIEEAFKFKLVCKARKDSLKLNIAFSS